MSERHYGLDWLRIAAFALLIVYHIGMVFAPWPWVIKTEHGYPELIVPMALLTPWRLSLLFAVSGYASRKLFDRTPGPGAFLRSRNARLLLPLAFGMAVLVPVEMWVRVTENGYPHGYLHFWVADSWRWGEVWGVELPSWEHLWFVAYLWAYTAVLCAGLAWAPAWAGPRIEAAIDWLARGHRLLIAPIAVLAFAKLAMLFVIPEKQGLFTDWSGHALYMPMFLFGFVLAGAPRLWPALARAWKPGLAISAAAGALLVWVELTWPGNAMPTHEAMAADRAAGIAMAWSMMLALFYLADRFANRDHRWRRTLAEAVFPFYLIHEPAIVLIAWVTLPYRFGPWTEFAILLAGTSAVCLAFYLVGREIRWLRPLIGLAPAKSQPRAVTPAAA